jgi:hypothetical protein
MLEASARASLGVLPLISRAHTSLLRGTSKRPLQLLRPSLQQRFYTPIRNFTTSQRVCEDEATSKTKHLHEKGDEAEEKAVTHHGAQKKADDRPWHRLSGSKQYKETSPDPSRGDESKGTPNKPNSLIEWLS